MLTVVADGCPGHEGGKDRSPSLIDEIVREGARRMLAEALRAEVDTYVAQFAAERGEDGRRLVVRNGYHHGREVLTSAGAIEVTAPRVNDKRTDPATGERMRFASAILPPWARKTPKITEVLPLLYLHGLSSGDFVPALGQFLGSAAVPNTISWPGDSPRSRKPARSMSSRVNGGRAGPDGRLLRTRCSRLGRLRSSRSTRITAEPDRSPRRTACHVRPVSA